MHHWCGFVGRCSSDHGTTVKYFSGPKRNARYRVQFALHRQGENGRQRKQFDEHKEGEHAA